MGQEIPLISRVQFLKDNCDKIEEIGYMKRFSSDDLATKKDELAEISIAMADIEEEKKEAMAEFKERLKPLVEERATLLKDIKTKAEFKNEQCYKFVDHDEKMVGYYNSEGELVSARQMRPDEAQTIIKLLTGTND